MTTQLDTTIRTLDDEIAAVLSSMAKVTEHANEDYKALTERLATLYKMKEIEHNHLSKQRELDLKANALAQEEYNNTRAQAQKDEELRQKQQELGHFDRVSKTTIVTAAVNLAGIIAILNHEATAVITSKALGFVGKLIK